MNIAGINYESIVDGPGVRIVIYVSGCDHNCSGCHNPAAFNFSAGRECTASMVNEIMAYIREHPYLHGITLSGGDPMYSATEVDVLLSELRQEFPGLSVWLYSGFTYEEIDQCVPMRSVLAKCDVLVDGEFVLSERDISLPYRGSRNQRIIDVSASLKAGEVVEITKEWSK